MNRVNGRYIKNRHLNEVVVKGVPLTEILINHMHWILEDVEGWQDMKADLRDCNLYALDLSGVNLSHVNLEGANLSFCNLRDANLLHANFTNANLSQSILINTNLACAVFKNTKLYYTNFSSATLEYANFSNVELLRCSFYRANLSNAGFYKVNTNTTDFTYADLDGITMNCTNFDRTDLSFSNLSNSFIHGAVKLGEYRTGKILTENIIGYKKCHGFNTSILDDVIVKLEIPKGAIVFSINGMKCRTNKAKVLEIEGADRALSYYNYLSYYVGDEINVYDFNCQYNIECGKGIHFFMTREEAEEYLY